MVEIQSTKCSEAVGLASSSANHSAACQQRDGVCWVLHLSLPLTHSLSRPLSLRALSLSRPLSLSPLSFPHPSLTCTLLSLSPPCLTRQGSGLCVSVCCDDVIVDRSPQSGHAVSHTLTLPLLKFHTISRDAFLSQLLGENEHSVCECTCAHVCTC